MNQKYKLSVGLVSIFFVFISLYMINADQRLPNINALEIPLEEGQVCLPYNPEGQFLYDAKWTGEYPEIEKFEGAFQTITLGMG